MSKKKNVAIGIGALLAIGMIGSALGGDEEPTVTPVATTAAVEAEPEALDPTDASLWERPAESEPEPAPAPEPEPEPAPEPEPEPVEAEPIAGPEPESAHIDEDVARIVLGFVWDEMSATERADICDMWAWGPEAQDILLDSFMEGAEGMMARDDAHGFFDGRC